MNRIKEHHIMAAIAIILMGVAITHDARIRVEAQSVTGDALNGIMGTTDGYTRLNITATPSPQGMFMPFSDPAAYEWHPGTLKPNRPDGALDPVTGRRIPRWPISIIPVSGFPDTAWYWDGEFRAYNGARLPTPARWAYWRLEPEKWNPVTKSFDIPGLDAPDTVPPQTTPSKGGVHMDDIAGQQLVDLLKRSFTWTRIQDFGDLSPYDEPDTGAPEDGPGSPTQ